MSGILTFVRHRDGAIEKSSLGAVSEAARLAAQLGVAGDVVVVGEGIPDDVAATLGAHGAATVHRATAPDGLAQPAVDAMAQLFAARDYDYALFGGGLLGLEVGAGLAARIDAGITVDVTAVAVVDGRLEAQRPILGGSAVSTSRYREKGVVIGRLNAFDVAERGNGPAELVDLDVELSPHAHRATMVRRGERRGVELAIEDADVLVTGGRGLGGPEGFDLCAELAEAFGGAVAATRAAVDAGWYPYAGQVGQTGKTVAPRLYVAVGVSGAVQHRVGMQGSEHVVAINRDADAPIFAFADLGIVGDLHRIVPKLIEAVRARRPG